MRIWTILQVWVWWSEERIWVVGCIFKSRSEVWNDWNGFGRKINLRR